MQYRAIDQSQYPEVKRLQLQCFHLQQATPFDTELDDPEWEYIRAAINPEGRIVASLALLPSEITLDGHIVPCGGIGGVVSAPDQRRGGHARRLMELALHEMYARGDVLSNLFPFSFAYYRQFGYEVGWSCNHITAPLDALLRYPMEGHFQQFMPELPGYPGDDPADIVHIYTQWAAAHNLATQRDGCRWAHYLEKDPNQTLTRVYTWYDAQRKPGAYVRLAIDKPCGDTMQIQDLCWVDRQALHNMLGFLGRNVGRFKKLTWSLPDSLAPETIWPEATQATAERRYVGMTRIINCRRALECMRKPLLPGSVTLRVQDDQLPANNGLWRVQWDGAGCTVDQPDGGDCDMTCSIQALAQLVTGSAGFTAISMRSDAQVHTNEAVLRALFTRKDCAVTDFF